MLKGLDHPNVVKCYEVYKTSDRNIYLAFQYCKGGNLYSRFPEGDEDDDKGKKLKVPFSEENAACILYQLLSALAYLHARGVCHRDVKFENIMFDNEASNVINLIDFGASCKFEKGTSLYDPIGTIYTMAREVLMGKYSEKADLWSMGVIMYMM